MASLGSAVLEVSADISKLKSGLEDAKRKAHGLLEKLGDFVGGAFKAAAVGAAAALGGLVAGLGICVSEAAESEEAFQNLRTALENAGDTAPMTMEALLDFASAQQSVTRYSDETVMAVEAMLLHFDGLTSETFPRAAQAALDLATAMGTDPVDAAKTLGIVLSDPAEGLSRLRRAGVVFTEEQEKLIQSLVASGKVVEAQGVVLDALADKYGGAAQAAGGTFAGTLDRLNNQFSEIKESIGRAVLPALQAFAQKIIEWLSSPQVQATIESIANWLSVALPAAVEFLAGVVQTVVGWISGFLEEHGGQIAAFFQGVFDVIMTIVGTIAGAIQGFLSAHQEEIAEAIAAVQGFIAGLVQFIQDNFGAVKSIIDGIWNLIKTAFETGAGVIGGVIMTLVNLVRGDFAGAWESFKGIFISIWDGLRGYFESVVQIFGGLASLLWAAIRDPVVSGLSALADWFRGVWEGLGDFFSGLASTAVSWGSGLLNAIWDGIKAVWEGVLSWFGGIDDALGGIFSGMWSTFEGFGRGLMEAVGSGLEAVWDTIKGWFEAALNALIDAYNAALGWIAGTIPHVSFQAGGLVGRTGLALVHEGEVVFNPSAIGGGPGFAEWLIRHAGGMRTYAPVYNFPSAVAVTAEQLEEIRRQDVLLSKAFLR